MRPFKSPNATLSLGDPCQVACEFRLPNQDAHTGWIQLGNLEFGSEFDSASAFEPETFLDCEAEVEIRKVGEFDLFTQCPGAIRLVFFLPPKRIVDDPTAHALIEKAASVLRLTPASLFPISVVSQQPIRGWRALFIVELHWIRCE